MSTFFINIGIFSDQVLVHSQQRFNNGALTGGAGSETAACPLLWIDSSFHKLLCDFNHRCTQSGDTRTPANPDSVTLVLKIKELLLTF